MPQLQVRFRLVSLGLYIESIFLLEAESLNGADNLTTLMLRFSINSRRLNLLAPQGIVKS
jgi:hypothetical protein